MATQNTDSQIAACHAAELEDALGVVGLEEGEVVEEETMAGDGRGGGGVGEEGRVGEESARCNEHLTCRRISLSLVKMKFSAHVGDEVFSSRG